MFLSAFCGHVKTYCTLNCLHSTNTIVAEFFGPARGVCQMICTVGLVTEVLAREAA